MVGSATTLGKPVGQDAARQRPSAARALGVHGARARLETLWRQLVEAVPSCSGQAAFQAWIDGLCARMFQLPRADPQRMGREPVFLDALAASA